MISITKVTVKDMGLCNFCSRGILREDESGLVYPYDHVFEISGDKNMSPTIRLCPTCLVGLKSLLTDVK